MEWTEIAPLVALGVGALGLSGIWYKLERIESKVDSALRMMRDHLTLMAVQQRRLYPQKAASAISSAPDPCLLQANIEGQLL